MSYARSRLILGMSGVGLLVLISVTGLVLQIPVSWLPQGKLWSADDVTAIFAVFAGLVFVQIPLDAMGGYVLPNRKGPNKVDLQTFLTAWCRGTCVQALFFVTASLLILALGRWAGVLGASAGVLALGLLLIACQLELGRYTGTLGQIVELSASDKDRIAAATRQTSAWGWAPRKLVVLTHRDPGFTGGVVGLPHREKIVLPAGMLDRLSSDELAVTIARRLEAVENGSRTRGVLVAMAWVLVGFNLCVLLPNGGVESVSELTTTCLGFTVWTFLGLLLLPSLSRQASFAIDTRVLQRGVPIESLHRSVSKFDSLQDDEPQRGPVIETIFHPVPSVVNRSKRTTEGPPIAWHAARMTLFLSWACMGSLVRVVHCNVGRPELWVMYPTD